MKQQFLSHCTAGMIMTPERCKTRVVSFMINLAKFLERVPKPYCWAEGVKRSG